MKHHRVTIATVPDEMKGYLEVLVKYEIPFRVGISSFRLRSKVSLHPTLGVYYRIANEKYLQHSSTHIVHEGFIQKLS